jgi:predicted DCC family thiol-disulfide oxidoreductase YuxK
MPVDNYLIYDGECPFCSNFVQMTKLRETIGPLRLINARENGHEVQAATAQGFVIDQGMLLMLDGKTYYGADCLNRLALLSSRSNVFNKLVYAMFRMPVIARLSYPVLKAGRAATIRLLGVSKMGY